MPDDGVARKGFAKCPVCSGVFDPVTGGRPRKFCCETCAEEARYKRRRVQHRLLGLETDLSNGRRDRTGLTDTRGATKEERIADIEAEIALASAELRELLDRDVEDD
jgi:hypothetical protein